MTCTSLEFTKHFMKYYVNVRYILITFMTFFRNYYEVYLHFISLNKGNNRKYKKEKWH